MGNDIIFEGIKEVLIEALNIDSEDITKECTLQGDLGAESIDFLDIVFRLEHKFNIKISKGELFPQDTPIEVIKNYSVNDLIVFITKKINENDKSS